MNGLLIVQGYLMAQMRARTLVEEGSVALGLTPQGLIDAREAAQELGLDVPGHPSSLYRQLLGQPTRTDIRKDVNKYSFRVDHYLVPPWGKFFLGVHSSPAGETSGLAFGKPDVENKRRPELESIAPWSTTLSELAMDDFAIADEWYPILDYEYRTIDNIGQRAILQFDFGLLQAVVLNSQP